MKYIITIIFLISISLYAEYDFQYTGNIIVKRDGKDINTKELDKVNDNDIIETKKNTSAEVKIKNKYYYIAQNSKVKITEKGTELISGAVYTRSSSFDSLKDFEVYDNNLQIYADPFPFYAGKVSTIFITSKDDIKIKSSKLLGSARPIVKFFEVKDADEKMKVYKSIFGIYVGAQDEKYQFVSNIELNDKTVLDVALNIKLDFTPPPPKPKQIPGVTSTMKNIISNPQ